MIVSHPFFKKDGVYIIWSGWEGDENIVWNTVYPICAKYHFDSETIVFE